MTKYPQPLATEKYSLRNVTSSNLHPQKMSLVSIVQECNYVVWISRCTCNIYINSYISWKWQLNNKWQSNTPNV